MKQAHDEILEKWLDDKIKWSNEVNSWGSNGFVSGYLQALRTVKDKLEELWSEK